MVEPVVTLHEAVGRKIWIPFPSLLPSTHISGRVHACFSLKYHVQMETWKIPGNAEDKGGQCAQGVCGVDYKEVPQRDSPSSNKMWVFFSSKHQQHQQRHRYHSKLWLICLRWDKNDNKTISSCSAGWKCTSHTSSVSSNTNPWHTWLDPKYSAMEHIRAHKWDPFVLFAGDLSPDLALLRAGAFITARLKVNRQRQGFPWQLHQVQVLPSSQGCPFAESLPLSLAGLEKVQGMKHWPLQEQNCIGYHFSKSRWFAASLWCDW